MNEYTEYVNNLMPYFQTSIQRKMRFNTNEYFLKGGEGGRDNTNEYTGEGGDNANEYTREGGV